MSSDFEYGCRGASNTSSPVPSSTTCASLITSTRSLIRRTAE
ncbi:hypothetical protein P6B95_39495 [Streptomyces atratus]|nr:hypothetical protein [Streptomyces atratus]WPW33790.1 hypothetical protein P6B95_39495 [Streptomyces atratus]